MQILVLASSIIDHLLRQVILCLCCYFKKTFKTSRNILWITDVYEFGKWLAGAFTLFLKNCKVLCNRRIKTSELVHYLLHFSHEIKFRSFLPQANIDAFRSILGMKLLITLTNIRYMLYPSTAIQNIAANVKYCRTPASMLHPTISSSVLSRAVSILNAMINTM